MFCRSIQVLGMPVTLDFGRTSDKVNMLMLEDDILIKFNKNYLKKRIGKTTRATIVLQ